MRQRRQPQCEIKLPLNREYDNKHDEDAVALLKEGEFAGHLPRTISRVS